MKIQYKNLTELSLTEYQQGLVRYNNKAVYCRATARIFTDLRRNYSDSPNVAVSLVEHVYN